MGDFVPCGIFAPDQPNYGSSAVDVVQNLVPRTSRSYGPMPSFQEVSTNPLNGRCLGAFSAHDSSGSPGVYAGTTTKLYAATNGSKPNFVDASGAQTFAVPQGGAWSFDTFKGAVYASNGTDPLQSLTAGTAGPFAAVSANAPKAKVIATIQPGFLLAGNINDVTVGVQNQGIRWCALGDATNWPLVGSTAAVANQSDWQAIQGSHGSLQMIAPNLVTCNAALFFERAIFRMIYTGDSKIFDIQPVEKQRGTPAPFSVVQLGQISYFLGNDGFYAFDGTIATPIGADLVNQTFFADADPNYLSGVRGVADPISGLCFWAYAGAGDNMGIPNRILVYNTIVKRWSLVIGWTGDCPFLALSFGTSLEGIDALGYTVDTLPFSMDSPFLAGGNAVLGAFDTTNTFGTFGGPAMAFQIQTSDTQLNPRGRTRVREIRPITEGADCGVAVAARNNLTDALVFPAPVAPNVGGVVPVRSEGRYHRALLYAPQGHNILHVLGAEFTGSPAGGR